MKFISVNRQCVIKIRSDQRKRNKTRRHIIRLVLLLVSFCFPSANIFLNIVDDINLYVCVYICICICVCVCVSYLSKPNKLDSSFGWLFSSYTRTHTHIYKYIHIHICFLIVKEFSWSVLLIVNETIEW